MPDFESLYELVKLARKQGCIDWAEKLERKIHELERAFDPKEIYSTVK